MKASEYLARFIRAINVERIYTLSGGMIAPLLDAIGEDPDLMLVPVSHEQAAAFAAETEGRLAHRPGIALGTNGPGALNLVSGIASAYYDSVPSIFIAGQVQTYICNVVPGARQSGLQQCNFQEVCSQISKAVYSPQRGEDVPRMLAEAYELCMSNRRGPVVIEIPLDVQTAETGSSDIVVPTVSTQMCPSAAEIEHLADALSHSTRPVMLIGGGARGANEICHRFATKRQLPVVSTIAGLDVSAGLGSLSIGMCGMYGSRVANTVLSEADFVLVVGSRVDHAVLGADPMGFGRKRTVWQIDVDAAEAGTRVKPSSAIIADAKSALEALDSVRSLAAYRVSEAWADRVCSLIEMFPSTGEREAVDGIDPNEFIERLGLHSGEACAYVVDAGHHTWFAAQSLKLRTGQRFVSSTGLHSCGTALPAAMATAFHYRQPVVAIVGDGSVQLNIQELATIMRERLPVKTVILNNSAHGSVRQLQTLITAKRYHASVWGLSNVDHVAVFSAYGVPSRRITSPAEIDEALKWLWEDKGQAQMLDVAFDTSIDVSPTVPFGRQISAMEPKRAPMSR
ncbi:MAG: thiamine pyrophosphate-binding protein [Edaphobacter sp.]|uniref:thiamine pyrophosphate-binding protein n=1 Tax=Edaphobacter sp. TaxID=1934404 RepID=UPI00298146E4|nr:thiamine pyrophosphate-binding protein [Edaphobacter sp.]MDW5265512.1 thiamine pyrophosphate-binding protein [Edaphobacter sp.]